jgi:hypothetical protein
VPSISQSLERSGESAFYSEAGGAVPDIVWIGESQAGNPSSRAVQVFAILAHAADREAVEPAADPPGSDYIGLAVPTQSQNEFWVYCARRGLRAAIEAIIASQNVPSPVPPRAIQSSTGANDDNRNRASHPGFAGPPPIWPGAWAWASGAATRRRVRRCWMPARRSQSSGARR